MTFSKINRNLSFLSDRAWDSESQKPKALSDFTGTSNFHMFTNKLHLREWKCLGVNENWGMGILKSSLFSPGRDEHAKVTHTSCFLTLCSSFPGLCSIWRCVIYTVHRLYLWYSRSGQWQSEITMSNDVWWLWEVWVKWFALSLNQSLTSGSLG